jgi:oligopeptide transport system ATP-binding protein
LDVTIQAQIIELIKKLQAEKGAAVILITHDLGVVANIAHRIVVMYSGTIVERGTSLDIFANPRHPYTNALLEAVPRLDLKNKQELASIEGTPPDLLNPPKGCPFSTRCKYCMEICCQEAPPVEDFGNGHQATCWLYSLETPPADVPFMHTEGGAV